MKDKIRVIARLDVKGQNVVKGVHLEGLRVVGRPEELAGRYNAESIDELIYIDSVASLYGRNNLSEVVRRMANETFVPVTVGGGIRSLDDIHLLLRSGADKVAINTEATKRPGFISEAAEKFGSQCIVLSIAAKKIGPEKWEAYTDNARERTGFDVVEWAIKGESLGAGEILLTSIDMEGTMKGFDLELYKEIGTKVSIPVIASGGGGSFEHIERCINNTPVSAIALASLFHYNEMTVSSLKRELAKNNIQVRMESSGFEACGVKGDEAASQTDKNSVVVIDFGLGNLFSVLRSFDMIGIKPQVVSGPEDVMKADRLVLPGVGCFKNAMAELKSRGLSEAVTEFAKTGKPVLGICLGAQMLMTESEEFGVTKGLDLIKGSVKFIRQETQLDGGPFRIPHIGWNSLFDPETGRQEICAFTEKADKDSGRRWGSSVLNGIAIGSEVYFVHSYKIIPDNREDLLSVCYYGGVEIAAVVKNGNITGCQFHPEKSGRIGMEILKNFVAQ